MTDSGGAAAALLITQFEVGFVVDKLYLGRQIPGRMAVDRVLPIVSDTLLCRQGNVEAGLKGDLLGRLPARPEGPRQGCTALPVCAGSS